MAEIGEKTPLEFALSNQQMEIHAFLECKWRLYNTEILVFSW